MTGYLQNVMVISVSNTIISSQNTLKNLRINNTVVDVSFLTGILAKSMVNTMDTLPGYLQNPMVTNMVKDILLLIWKTKTSQGH